MSLSLSFNIGPPKINLNFFIWFLTNFMWMLFRYRYNSFEILTNFSTWDTIRSFCKIFPMHVWPPCVLGKGEREIIPQLPGCVMCIGSNTASLIEFGIVTRSSTQRQPDFTWRSFQNEWTYGLTSLHLTSSSCMTQSRISFNTASLLVRTARKDFVKS